MKELFIIRHAKSSWKDINLTDFERPLNKRGLRDAPFMGEHLKELGYKPDFIISSPANRANTTAIAIASKVDFKDPLVTDESIYEASASTLLDVINKFDDKYNRVFMFGHNPGSTYLAEKLSGEYFGNIPTCGIVGLSFDFDSWELVSAGTASKFFYDYPKNHF